MLKNISDKNSIKEEWTKIIRPPSGWFNIDIKRIWHYRDLIKLFVYRDFVIYYKQTILGPIWWVIQPLFTSGIFTLIFGKIAKIPTDEIPAILFYMSGVIIWNYFSNSLLEISRTFVKSATMFGKVYFPRMVIPISIVISEFFKFLIQFSVFLLIYSIFLFKGSHITVNWMIIFLPLFIIQTGLLALGFGIIAASFTTKYRDLILAVNFLVQLWMYATPVVYPLSLLPEKWKILSILNPMTQVIESFRLAMLGAGTVTATAIIINIFITLLVLITGIILFSRVEKNFMDTV